MRGRRAKPTGRARSIPALGVVLVAAFLVVPTEAGGNTAPRAELTPDLMIKLETGANPVHSQSTVLLEAQIANRGTAVAGSTRAIFAVPATGIVVDGSAGDCTAVGSTVVTAGETPVEQPWSVVCSLGTLAPGSVVDLAFSMTSGSPGTHLVSASVESDHDDARPADNDSEFHLFVLPDEPAFLQGFQEPGPTNRLNRADA